MYTVLGLFIPVRPDIYIKCKLKESTEDDDYHYGVSFFWSEIFSMQYEMSGACIPIGTSEPVKTGKTGNS